MYNQSYDPASYRMESRSISFPAVMKNVYLWMTFALAMTGRDPSQWPRRTSHPN